MIKRILFFVAVGNTDDHLRNCGFLLIDGRWELSPLFDVNPNPYENAAHITSIFGDTADRSITPIRDLVKFAGISAQETSHMIKETLDVASNWKAIARNNGIPESEIKRFQPSLSNRMRMLATFQVH